MEDNSSNAHGEDDRSQEPQLEATMGGIIQTLDRFECVIKQVSERLQHQVQNRRQISDNSTESCLMETHLIIDDADRTEVLRCPLQTISELELISNPPYSDVFVAYLKNQFMECNENIVQTLNQIVSNQLLLKLSWEEEPLEDLQEGRVSLQNFALFTHFLYGKLNLSDLELG